jgi:DNA-binding response OmpR family regulator
VRILIIEDEPKLNEHLRRGLEQQNYTVDSALNGSEGLELASAGKHDLIILDIMLPGQSGLEVLDNLRRFELHTPVIIVSALNASDRIIEGLDRGAADYIRKPFDFGELLARVRAVTRKHHDRNVTRYRIGNVELDLMGRKAMCDSEEVVLTKREFELLELLMARANRVVTKAEIAESIWEVNFDMSSNVIEVHMSQLRKKLHKADLIKTRVGVGYFIEGQLVKSSDR